MKQYKQNKTDCVRLQQQAWIIVNMDQSENTKYVPWIRAQIIYNGSEYVLLCVCVCVDHRSWTNHGEQYCSRFR